MASDVVLEDGEFAAVFKIVLLGHSGVGKTSLLQKFTTGKFSGSLTTTVGIDYKEKAIRVDGIPILLKIWDTAGQERFRSFTNQYLRGAQGIVMVHSVASLESFETMTIWMESTVLLCYADVPIVIVGNKVDLDECRFSQKEKEMNTIMFNKIGQLVAYHNGLYIPTRAGMTIAKRMGLVASQSSSISHKLGEEEEKSVVLSNEPNYKEESSCLCKKT